MKLASLEFVSMNFSGRKMFYGHAFCPLHTLEFKLEKKRKKKLKPE